MNHWDVRIIAVCLCAAPILAPAVATAQDVGSTGGETPFNCSQISAADPAEAERLLYFISGYEAGLAASSGGGSGDETSDGESAADIPADPRLGQVIATPQTAFHEIPVQEIQAACLEEPDRPVSEVLAEMQPAAPAAEGGDEAEEPAAQ